MVLLNVISSSTGGGAELLVRELHRRLLQRGVNSNVVYFSGSFSRLVAGEDSFRSSPRALGNIFRLRNKIKSLIRDSNSTLVVHAHLTWPFIFVALASLGLDVRLVFTEHSTFNRRRRIPFFWLIERLIYARYDAIITISNGVYNSTLSWVGSKFKKRMVIVPNGSRIYRLAQRVSLEGRKPRLLSVGSLAPHKNFATVLKAIYLIKEEISHYTIVGEGTERSVLETLICHYNLSDMVTLTGWSDNLEHYFHESDLQVIPSSWEGFGLVAVEGMSTGLPVIASNVPGLREVLGETNPAVKLVDDLHDPSAWAEAISDTVAHLRRCDPLEVTTFSRLQAEKFTFDAMLDSYLKVYCGL